MSRPPVQRWHRLVPWAVFVALCGYFLSIHLGTDRLACIDVFYHMRLARLMLDHGFIRDFPWMRFAILHDHWVDQHFLFHVLLMPFTLLKFPLGAKLAATLFAAAALTFYYVFMRRQEIRLPHLWLLLLPAASSGFLYRMNMVRGQSLALGLFLLFLVALLERRPRLAGLVGGLFVWFYQLFLLLVPLAAWVALVDRGEPRTAPPATGGRPAPAWFVAPLWGVAGVAAGLLLNPFFPQDLLFTYEHAVVKVLNRARLGVGGEWGPFDSWYLVTGNVPLWLALALAMGLLLFCPGPLSRRTRVLAGAAALFLGLQLHSRRFIEYWPPFGLLFAATVITDRFPWESARSSRLYRPALALLIGLAVVLALVNRRQAVRDIAANLPVDRYRGAAQWLEQHSRPGELIFTTDWDDFAELFYYNQQNSYLVGLDPTFMYLHDRQLFAEWDLISTGQLALPAGSIRRDFGARLVFTDQAHAAFIARAEQDPELHRVYGDGECLVFEVLPAGSSAVRHVEGESRYPPLRSGGSACRIQNVLAELGVSCSNDRVLLYRAAEPGDFLEISLPPVEPGRYRCMATFLTAPDYGIADATLDGMPGLAPFDGYGVRVAAAEPRILGEWDLGDGVHCLRLTVRGRNPAARGYFVGLDELTLEPLPGQDPPADP